MSLREANVLCACVNLCIFVRCIIEVLIEVNTVILKPFSEDSVIPAVIEKFH